MIKTIFWGTPDFSVPTLKMLHQNPSIDLVAVISNPDKKSGRGQKVCSPPVITYCKEHSINFYQTENINNEIKLKNLISNLEPELFIVLAFSQFLDDSLLSIPKKGSFNIHTSLLPKYRGAAPIQYALLNGDSSTGVSIQKMVKKMDAGDICHSFPVAITENETGGQLYDKLKEQAALSCKIFISELNNNILSFLSQDESNVTFAPSLVKNDGLLNFPNQTFDQLKNRIRAFDPWPGTFIYLNNKRLKVFEIEKSHIPLAPGELSTKYQTLNIGCLNGSARLKKIQLEGKKTTSDTDLLNGIKDKLLTRYSND